MGLLLSQMGKLLPVEDQNQDNEQDDSSSRLPEGYQEVEYIELDNDEPHLTYIISDIKISNISKVICKYGYTKHYGLGSYHPMILAAYSNNSTSAPWITTDGVASGSVTINPVAKNESVLDPTEFIAEYNSTSNLFLKIGGWSDISWTAVGQYYYVKIYDKNNELVFDGIPCYQKSDEKVGMYDLVTNKFYASAGTKEFSKGDDV